jgi:hypothetical protein
VIRLTGGCEVEKSDHSPEPATATQESRGDAGTWAAEAELAAEVELVTEAELAAETELT